MLASGFMGTGQVADSSIATTTATTTVTVNQNLKNNKNSNFDQKVQNFASDKPLMIEIAYCESQFRQYNKDGSVLRGRVNNLDVGLFQINEYYHLERSKKLGYDIYSPEGNMAYARVLFNEEGPTPWSSSSPCWSKTNAYMNYSKAMAEKADLIAIK